MRAHSRMMFTWVLAFLLFGAASHADVMKVGEALRPPAVPLVTHDPYFSLWSCADRLTDVPTRHWTGARQALTSLIRIDGKVYRLMGDEPKEFPPLEQVRVEVTPTRTIYRFQGAGMMVTLTFMTPALPSDLDVLSRPVTYLTWEARSLDNKAHTVSLYYDNTAEPAVNTPNQKVVWSRQPMGALTALRVGTEEQPVLQKKGDDLRIDWGYLYAASPSASARGFLGEQAAGIAAFQANGRLLERDETRMTRAVNDGRMVAAFAFDLGAVKTAPVSRTLMLAYDDLYSIVYFRQKLRPYWRRNGKQAADLLQAAARDYPALQKRCKAFDTALTADLKRAGGEKYARLCALAFRQCFAAHKLVADANGQPLLFSKENFSNGCIATVDVIYPTAPFFLLLNPTLAKASLVPVLDYASDRWKFPFAPHDLGTYPHANGQVYGGGERTEQDQMPVEESGNMLILLAALAHVEGNAEFAFRYWPQITSWARYLVQKGFDPENQLCTDDFAGHLAHNVNLSAKALVALRSYGLLCKMREDQWEKQDKVNPPKGPVDRLYESFMMARLTRELVEEWVRAANDGDHYRLAFDRPGTWSQKYNLVWDRLLGLNLFPRDALRKEFAFYRKSVNRYGLPLDNRRDYTKLDWLFWTATLMEDRKDFEDLTARAYAFLHETPDRVPMTDWYDTKNGRKSGFQARSVVGGVFIKMLADPALWKRWAKNATPLTGKWAPLPRPPQVTEVVPDARRTPIPWRYTFTRPGEDWFKPGFADADWREGDAGFGTKGTPGAVVRTEWKTPDIWLRREFTLPAGTFPGLRLWVHHDEDVNIYINGVLAAEAAGYTTDYDELPIRDAARAALKPGRNTLAVHCRQTGGGQYIDVGLVNVVEAGKAGTGLFRGRTETSVVASRQNRTCGETMKLKYPVR